MRRSAVLAIAYLAGTFSQAQDLPENFARSITAEDLKEHLTILASDALEGRETGERGQKMAATYLEHFFRSNDLQPIVETADGKSYLQKFELVNVRHGKTWVKVDDEIHEGFVDLVYTGQRNFTEPVKSSLVLVGTGKKEDFEAIEIKNKNVLLCSDGNRMVRDSICNVALELGAKNVFIMHLGTQEEFQRIVTSYKHQSNSGKLVLPPVASEIKAGYFLVSLSLGASIMNTNEKNMESAIEKSTSGKYASLLKLRSKEITFFSRQNIRSVLTENVLGFIEGTDKKEEYLILTAHYDHVGRKDKQIFNGADDDGSGTVSIMEIAQAFSLARQDGHGPRRSLLFMAVSGEEKGLLGSSYYVENPVLPLRQTIANLNLDMVGRVDNKHLENPEYIYLIGSDKLSKDLHQLSEEINDKYAGLELDYTFNADNDPNRFYYRSDHYNFAKNNIPIIFYFNGTHADYHRATDTVDKIEFEIMEKRARLVFHTAWEIANREEPVTLDAVPGHKELMDSK